MNIAITLQHLFPNSTPRVDWLVVNDGSGEQIKEWNLSAPQPTQSELETAWATASTQHYWSMIRSERKPLLESSDWTQLPDSPLSKAKKDKWKSYRQALRDITKQSNPESVEWPSQPEA